MRFPGWCCTSTSPPETPGTYPILCTQVCGSGHARMQAVLRVVSPGEYAAWLDAREQRLRKVAQ